MKITKFYLLLTIITFFGSCSSIKTTQKTINHKYTNLIFSPEKIQKLALAKTEVTITPVDAKEINRETFEAASRDGNYEREYAVDLENLKNETGKQSNAEKTFIQGLINGVKAVERLKSDNLIPAYTANQLIKRILDGENNGFKGTEVNSFSDSDFYPGDFNPYKLNANYLSVFKLTFENKGTENEKINLKEFQIVSDRNCYIPLGLSILRIILKRSPKS